MKNINNQNWREPTNKRCFYIDLEFQGRIWVDKETYKNYMRKEWSEWKRKERSTRCQIPNDKNGLKRCSKDCKGCPYFRNGHLVSLDELYEKYELEQADKSSSIIEKMNEEERNKAIWDAISELDEINEKIMKLFSEGYSEREIAEVLGMPRATISYRKKISFEILRSKLEDYHY